MYIQTFDQTLGYINHDIYIFSCGDVTAMHGSMPSLQNRLHHFALKTR